MALNRNMFMQNRNNRQAPMAAQQAPPPRPNAVASAAKSIGSKVITDKVITPALTSVFAPEAAATGATAAATGATAASGGMMAALGPAVAAAAPVAIPLMIAAAMFGRKKK